MTCFGGSKDAAGLTAFDPDGVAAMEGIWEVSRAVMEIAQCGGTSTVSSPVTTSPTSTLSSTCFIDGSDKKKKSSSGCTGISVPLLAVLSAGALLL